MARATPSSTAVYLEVGAKRTFACAVDWPGWCRSGRDEDHALETLAAYASRYAACPAAVRIAFRPPGGLSAPRFDVVDRFKGNATTDFGAPGVVPRLDDDVPSARDAARLASLMEGAWIVLDAVVASAPAKLRKGPRGGGRDRDAIAEHVLAAEGGYGPKIGVRGRGLTMADTAEVAAFRGRLLDAVRAREPEVSGRAKPWPVRYAARRIAWHALDHAWEIEDKSE
jgi:hypothetical protein